MKWEKEERIKDFKKKEIKKEKQSKNDGMEDSIPPQSSTCFRKMLPFIKHFLNRNPQTKM